MVLMSGFQHRVAPCTDVKDKFVETDYENCQENSTVTKTDLTN